MVIVTNDPDKYAEVTDLATPGGQALPIFHRDELDRVQRELREYPGVSVLIYDQMCATEARRRRKRGKLPPVARRVVIHPEVCEGCGDCSRQSNCLSVVPLETPFGTKRAIDQSACNQDFSCLKGFCPSFVTLDGVRLKKGAGLAPPAAGKDAISTVDREKLGHFAAAGLAADRRPLQPAAHRRRRHGRDYRRGADRDGRTPRRQGRLGARHDRAGAEVRGGLLAPAHRRPGGGHPRGADCDRRGACADRRRPGGQCRQRGAVQTARRAKPGSGQ